jgi:hypothetical protein
MCVVALWFFDLAHFFTFGLSSKIKFGSMYTLHTPLDDIYCTCVEFYYKLK